MRRWRLLEPHTFVEATRNLLHKTCNPKVCTFIPTPETLNPRTPQTPNAPKTSKTLKNPKARTPDVSQEYVGVQAAGRTGAAFAASRATSMKHRFLGVEMNPRRVKGFGSRVSRF